MAAPDAARVFSEIIAARQTDRSAPVDVESLMTTVWSGLEPRDAWDRFQKTDLLLRMNFGLNFLDPSSQRSSGRRDAGWQTGRDHERSDIFEHEGSDDGRPTNGTVTLSESLQNMLDIPLPLSPCSDPAPDIDAQTMQWLTTIKGLSRSGSGAHLALRRGRAVRREIADLAALLAGEGIIVRSIDCTVNDLPAALLGAELHAGASPDVIVIDHNHLVVGPSVAEEEEEDLIWDAPKSGNATLKPSTFVSPTPTWLPQLRNIYLWRIPEYGAVAASQVPFVSGCIGPLQHDPNWCRKILDGILASEATTHNPVCTRTLMGRLDDPRDGRPIARVAGVMSGQTGLALAEACAIVASSFVEGHRAPPVLGPDFDPRFLVCEPEAHLLLGRASQLSSNGARVLAWGPPGGGKSSFARALALGMANGRTVSVVTPSAILARPWGATERLIRAMWRRAASEGEVLVADEFEVICGVREGGAGNGYLIRCLTDEWLRALDDYPDVPLVATVNDVHAVDNAAVRRFVFVLEFKDTLTPHQEGLAWDIILRCSPPTGWQPCGAAIADLALAKHRCRMLGLADAASLSTAVLRARDARLGKSGKSRTTKAPRSSLN